MQTKKKTAKQMVKEVADMVTLIENTRSDLFIKVLPRMFQEHLAKIVRCDNIIWIVATEDKVTLKNINKVIYDSSQDLGEHIRIFDEKENEIVPVPKDIIALYQNMGTIHPTNSIDQLENI